MKLPNNLFSLILIAFIILCSFASTASYAKQERSQAAKNDFKALHPCPSNGKNYGPCPGFVIDHITPLACSGNDAPINMQWQTVAEGKAKDKWERKDCQVNSSGNRLYSTKSSFSGVSSSITSSSNEYHIGKRGGCFTYSASGKKRYVDHSRCS
jgi:hypothetical protein